MVQAAIEQYEPPERRLVSDDLALSILPARHRALVRAMRWPLLRRLTIAAGERAVRGSWSLITCRKRYIDDKLDATLDDIDSVVILGSGMDTRAYRLAHRSDIPVFEVDLPVNIERKRAAVRRAIGGVPASVHLVPLDFERDDLIGALTENGYRRRLPHILHLGRRDAVSDRGRGSGDARRVAAGPCGQSVGVHLSSARISSTA